MADGNSGTVGRAGGEVSYDAAARVHQTRTRRRASFETGSSVRARAFLADADDVASATRCPPRSLPYTDMDFAELPPGTDRDDFIQPRRRRVCCQAFA